MGDAVIRDEERGASLPRACAACGAETGQAKFCPECGEAVPQPRAACPGCGHEPEGEPKFCPECGAVLGAC